MRNRGIIVIGAGGVGKTTLVEALAPLLNLPVIPELGRQICAEMGHSYIGEVPDQEGFKRKVLERQIETELELGSFISDRSTIDCWVLWQRWNLGNAMTYDTETYYKLARQQSRHYTDVIYIPPMFPAEDDGFRWTDPDYQIQVDRLVRMTLFEWSLWDRTITVSASNPAERRDEVLAWLNERTVHEQKSHE